MGIRNDILLPTLTLVGGFAGFGLRRWQLSSAYDPLTQLFDHAAPATYALLAVVAVVGLLLVLLGRGGEKPRSFFAAYTCPSPLYITAMVICAFLFMGAGGLGLLRGLEELAVWRTGAEGALLTYPIALILGALLCFPAGIGILLMGRYAYRGTVSPACRGLSTLPAFATLVWLFSTHLQHGTDPVMMGYGFSLAAAALLMLAHYYTCAFFFSRPHPYMATFCALMGTCVGIISLADLPSPALFLLTVAAGLSALVGSVPLLRSRFGPPWPKRLLEGALPSQPVDPAHPQTNDAI